MKKQELYNILCGGRTIYRNLTEDDMFNVMDQLSHDFYETGVPKPEDIMVELVSIED